MFKMIVAGALALGATSGAAYAAPPAPVYNWTGLYVGGFAGAVGGNITPEISGAGPSGIDTGVTLGYAWQGNGDWVFEPFLAIPINGQTGAYGSYLPRIDWAVLAGLKVGLATGRWLPYAFVAGVTAGVSATDGSTTEHNTHTGVSFGLGTDYALNDRWSVGARFAHVTVEEKHYFFSNFGWSGNSIAATVNFKLK